MRLPQELREILGKYPQRLQLARRLGLLLVVIALAAYLSTLNLGGSSAEDPGEGDWALALISWAVVLFVGATVVRWLRRELRDLRRRYADLRQ